MSRERKSTTGQDDRPRSPGHPKPAPRKEANPKRRRSSDASPDSRLKSLSLDDPKFVALKLRLDIVSDAAARPRRPPREPRQGPSVGDIAPSSDPSEEVERIEQAELEAQGKLPAIERERRRLTILRERARRARSRALYSAVAALGDRDTRLFNCRLSGMSYREAGESLNVCQATTRRAVFRILASVGGQLVPFDAQLDKIDRQLRALDGLESE
jgi:DNA-directed RNA polymerase specialized sigma24 family protein